MTFKFCYVSILILFKDNGKLILCDCGGASVSIIAANLKLNQLDYLGGTVDIT